MIKEIYYKDIPDDVQKGINVSDNTFMVFCGIGDVEYKALVVNRWSSVTHDLVKLVGWDIIEIFQHLSKSNGKEILIKLYCMGEDDEGNQMFFIIQPLSIEKYTQKGYEFVDIRFKYVKQLGIKPR
jgi:hypothetical protein